MAQTRSALGRGPVLPSVPTPSRPTSAPRLHLPAQLRPLVWPTGDPDRDLLLLGSVWLTPLLWAVAEKKWSRLGWGEPFSARPPSVLLRVPQTPRCPPWARGADCDTLSLQSPPAPMFSELWALPPLPLRRAAHQEKEGQQLAAQSWCRASDTHSKSAEGAQQPLNCCRRHCLVCGVGAILGVT